MLIFLFASLLLVTVQSNFASIGVGMAGSSGFTWTYDISDPDLSGKIYWALFPDGVTVNDADIVSANGALPGCSGSRNQEDDQLHEMQMECTLEPGTRYNFFVAVADNDLDRITDCTVGGIPVIPAPKKDCEGVFSTCSSTCYKTYTVTQWPSGGGADCLYYDEHEELCSPGEGDCPSPPAEFTADSVTAEGFDIHFTPSSDSDTDGGTYYYAVVPSSAAWPDADAIKLGGGADSVCSGSYPVTGLSVSTHTISCAEGPGTFRLFMAHDPAGDGNVKLAEPESGTSVEIPDLDECAATTPPCDANAACANTDGSFTCTCNAGWEGDGTTCTDVNECDGTNDCSPNAACTNTDGSYTCECNDGYSGDGKSCSDVNECASADANDCDPNATCTNSVGAFTCACDTGYSGDGKTCADVDECGETNDCSPNASCTNTIGSYTCSCNTGFTGDGNTCNDINECGTGGTNDCSANALCTNTVGSYTCACASGYTGDGYSCADVNECDAENDCASTAICTNTPGSYTCACDTGFTGDGFSCVEVPPPTTTTTTSPATGTTTSTSTGATTATSTGSTTATSTGATTATSTGATTATSTGATTATSTGVTTATSTGTITGVTTGTTSTGTATSTTTGTVTSTATGGSSTITVITGVTTGVTAGTTTGVTAGTTTGVSYYAAECERLLPAQCTAASHCFWDGSECEGREIGEGMLTVCGQLTSLTCGQNPICSWTGVVCLPRSAEMEYESTCESLRGPAACATKPDLCTFDFSEGECLTKAEYEIETELKCESMPMTSCNAPCQWSYAEMECVEAETEMERESYFASGCVGKTDANSCYSAGNCVWMSARCYAVGELDIVLQKENPIISETDANPNYFLVSAIAFVSSFVGVIIAMRCKKAKDARLDDVLLENRFSRMA